MDAPLGLHVLGVGHAGDGRDIETGDGGDILEYHGPQVALVAVEEILPLPVDDGLCDQSERLAPLLYCADKSACLVYLLFGKETKGLPEELLMQHPDDTLRLPMIDEARSLNLSNSVAIAAYEVLRQWDYPALQNKGELHNHKWSDLNNMT